MSMISIIAKQCEGGVIKSIYCRWDGYLKHNGRILDESYKYSFKVDELIKLGDILFLGKTLYSSPLIQEFGFNFSVNEEYNKLRKEEQDEYLDEESSMLYTTACGRDEGQEDTNCIIHTSFDDFDKFCKRERESVDFVYLFKNGEWYAKENGIFNESVEFRKLSEIMEEIYEKEKMED